MKAILVGEMEPILCPSPALSSSAGTQVPGLTAEASITSFQVRSLSSLCQYWIQDSWSVFTSQDFLVISQDFLKKSSDS